MYFTFTRVGDRWECSRCRARRQTGERWLNWAATGYKTNVASEVCDVISLDEPLWNRRISERQIDTKGWIIVWHDYGNNNFQLITSSGSDMEEIRVIAPFLCSSSISPSYASKAALCLIEYSCYNFCPPTRTSQIFVRVSPRCLYKELLSRSSFYSISHSNFRLKKIIKYKPFVLVNKQYY